MLWLVDLVVHPCCDVDENGPQQFGQVGQVGRMGKGCGKEYGKEYGKGCGKGRGSDAVHFIFLDTNGCRVVKTAAQPYRPYFYVMLSSTDELSAVMHHIGRETSLCASPERHGGVDLEFHMCECDVHLVHKKRMDGFQSVSSPFLRIRCCSVSDLRRISGRMVDAGFHPFERPVGPVWAERQLMDLGSFRCCNWIVNADLDEWPRWQVDSSNITLPPFRWIAADLETFSIGGKSVEPDPTRPTDPIFNCCTSLFCKDVIVERHGWVVTSRKQVLFQTDHDPLSTTHWVVSEVDQI